MSGTPQLYLWTQQVCNNSYTWLSSYQVSTCHVLVCAPISPTIISSSQVSFMNIKLKIVMGWDGLQENKQATWWEVNNARPHSARVKTAWLRRHRVRVLDWPACNPDLSPIENVWRIMKRRIRQRRPRTVEQLKSGIHKEWAKIPLAKLQQLISSVPKRLQSFIKRKGDVTRGKHASVPPFFWVCCRHNFFNLFMFNK